MEKRNQPLTQEAFDSLLTWLHPDREQAGKTYEEIRRKLINLFLQWGSSRAEELRDETINRVAWLIEANASEYAVDPALYFFHIARRVYRETSLPGKKLIICHHHYTLTGAC